MKIERHEGKRIIVVICWIIIQYASINDTVLTHGVCINEYEILNYVAYSDHLFWALLAFKF